MIGYRHISVVLSAMFLMSLAFVVSCSDVQFKDVAPGDGVSPVQFDIDWSGVEMAEDDYPHMTIMMSRVKSSTKHYLWNVDGQGNFLDEEEEVGSMLNGQYILLGFSTHSEGINIVGIDDFEESESVRMTEVCAEIPRLTDQQVQDMGVVTNNNPASPFIYETSPVYCAVAGNDRLMQVPSKEDMLLQPKAVTCKISISGDLRVEEGVEMVGMAAIVSGVPYKVNLMSGSINSEETGKVYFQVPVERTSETPDEENMYGYRYSGTVDALGLFLSSNPLLDSGDGILEIIVRAKVTQSEGEGEPEKEYFREFNVTLNLSGDSIEPEVTQDMFMKLLPDKSGYVLNCSQFDFNMVNVLEVTKENVTSESAGGLESWKPNEDSTDKDLNPGLNPEV